MSHPPTHTHARTHSLTHTHTLYAKIFRQHPNDKHTALTPTTQVNARVTFQACGPAQQRERAEQGRRRWQALCGHDAQPAEHPDPRGNHPVGASLVPRGFAQCCVLYGRLCELVVVGCKLLRDKPISKLNDALCGFP